MRRIWSRWGAGSAFSSEVYQCMLSCARAYTHPVVYWRGYTLQCRGISQPNTQLLLGGSFRQWSTCGYSLIRPLFHKTGLCFIRRLYIGYQAYVKTSLCFMKPSPDATTDRAICICSLNISPRPLQDGQLVAGDLQDVMQMDGLASSHPVYQAVSNPAEINELFDSITYFKVTQNYSYNSSVSIWLFSILLSLCSWYAQKVRSPMH